MATRLIFWLTLTALIAAGTWGLSKIVHIPSMPFLLKTENSKQAQDITDSKIRTTQAKPSAKHRQVSHSDSNKHYLTATYLLKGGQADSAAEFINQQHSHLSQPELLRLRQSFIQLALSQSDQSFKFKSTLLAASSAFDDIEIWELLANAAIKDMDWALAHQAQIKVSLLENQPERLQIQLERLLFTAQKLHKVLKENGDELSIKNLYENLSTLHPSFSRFQLELALSLIRLNETSSAITNLNNLIYDPDFGTIAQRTIKNLSKSNENLGNSRVDSKPSNDIVVPLIAAGNSFLIDVNIEQKPARLLLDTGASITSLSSSLIETLNLKNTGKVIALSTANGIKNSKLYSATRLQIGRIILNDMLVAEIDLSNNNGFQGLLGTDALNQVKGYNYLINNQKRALIFQQY